MMNGNLPFNCSDGRSLESREVVSEVGDRFSGAARDQLALGRRPEEMEGCFMSMLIGIDPMALAIESDLLC